MPTATVQRLKFFGSYNYAQTNGFEGAHGQYVDMQYKSYVQTCRDTGLQPQTFAVWYSVQTH